MPTFSGEVSGPGRARGRWGVFLLAGAVHVVAGAGLVIMVGKEREPAMDSRILVLAPRRPPATPVEALRPTSPPEASRPDSPARPEPRLSAAGRAPSGGDLRWPVDVAGQATAGRDSGDARTRIGLSYERGHLWVPPLPFSPEEVAEHFGLSHVEKVDSAVKAIVQAYLDSLSVDSSLRPVRPPSWVTEIAGVDFGLDSRFIYFAGLKIPTVLLALLPLPAGDFDREKRYQQMMEMRREIYYSAWRADTQEEFKENVRKLRARKEEERRLREAQRLPPGLSPDSGGSEDP